MSRSLKLLSILFAVLLVAGLLVHSFQAQATERWVAVGQLQTERAGACSVQLSDGRTLITGGEDSGGVLSSAEVFDSSGSSTDVAAMLYADTIGKRLAIGWSMGTIVSALGVYLSLKLDLPTGATMVCTFGLVLILMAVVRPLVQGSGTTEMA